MLLYVVSQWAQAFDSVGGDGHLNESVVLVQTVHLDGFQHLSHSHVQVLHAPLLGEGMFLHVVEHELF